MGKNKKYPGSMKMYLVGGLAIAAMASIFTISSCKKDAASVKAGVAEPSSTPITYGKYTYFSNTNKHVGIMVEDANGNLVTIESIRKAKGNLAEVPALTIGRNGTLFIVAIPLKIPALAL